MYIAHMLIIYVYIYMSSVYHKLSFVYNLVSPINLSSAYTSSICIFIYYLPIDDL